MADANQSNLVVLVCAVDPVVSLGTYSVVPSLLSFAFLPQVARFARPETAEMAESGNTALQVIYCHLRVGRQIDKTRLTVPLVCCNDSLQATYLEPGELARCHTRRLGQILEELRGSSGGVHAHRHSHTCYY